MSDGRLPRHAPATLRNREPILAVLTRTLPKAGLLLEVASGTGEHAAFIAPRLADGLVWQPSEASVEALADIDARTSRTEFGDRSICHQWVFSTSEISQQIRRDDT